MEINLKYAKEYLSLSLPDKNVLATLNIKSVPGIKDVEAEFKSSLNNPIGSPPLSDIIKNKNAKNAVVVVSDYTRAIPYATKDHNILINLIDLLNENGISDDQITLLVGGGTHRAHKPQENLDNFGQEIVGRVKIIDHNCDTDVVEVGTLSTGNKLEVNHNIIESDLVILTGIITTHYFAGFSGGRKAILPAVSGRETIRKNHAMVLRDGVGIGKLEGNPISDEMSEAAAMAKPDFLINMVINDKKEIVNIASGHLHEAFKHGVEKCKEVYTVKINQLADAAFVSAGGFPKDANLLQVQKTLNNGKELIKKGGTLVLIAQCSEGTASAKFEKWLGKVQDPYDLLGTPEEELEVGGHTAVNTAKQLHDYDIVLVTQMAKDECSRLHFNWEANLESAIARIKKKHGDNFTSYIVPYGGLIFPVFEDKK
ncbi:MAG: nickel-dependent lactate racemase [Bacteriovoracaceae bacterium]|nr:nickel-dependent lactate racemase [Bacteriovoracaceae bacterium]